MARCELTGKGAAFGRNVSHSNRKSSRQFLPNVQNVTFASAALDRKVRMSVTTRAIRTVQKYGGIDGYLLKTADAKLTPRARKLKREIQRKLSGGKPASAAAS